MFCKIRSLCFETQVRQGKERDDFEGSTEERGEGIFNALLESNAVCSTVKGDVMGRKYDQKHLMLFSAENPSQLQHIRYY